jgi:hypothetical protein
VKANTSISSIRKAISLAQHVVHAKKKQPETGDPWDHHQRATDPEFALILKAGLYLPHSYVSELKN